MEDVAWSSPARACHVARVPMVPFGAGTSLAGHVAAVDGGLWVDLGRMRRVLDASPEAIDRRVEAEHGEALAAMAAIEAALDPRGIMNPGKMLLPSALSRPFT